MKAIFGMTSGPGQRGQRARLSLFWIGVLALAAGCGGVFNAAFLDLVDSSGSSATISNSTGHVVIAFVNNAEVDERLITYLTSTGGLDLSDAETRALRPRVRLRLQVTFSSRNADDTPVTNTFEMISGSKSLIDSNYDAQAFADLNQNDLENVVVLCDVDRVEILPGSSVEVFIPVQLTEWAFRDIENTEGGVTRIAEVQQRINPQFRPLEVDALDADGNVTTRANIGVRDMPGPVVNPGCGSVVALTMSGVLSVPFLDQVDDNPSYDVGDLATVASVGGRYEMQLSVR